MKKNKPLGKPLQKKPLSKPKPLAKAQHKVTRSAVEAPKAEVRPKQGLVKVEPKQAPPSSRPVPSIPKGFPWKGKKDPTRTGKLNRYLLVKPENMPDGFPVLHDKCLPDSFWRVDPKSNTVRCMVTVLPDGLHAAWGNCSVCLNSDVRCVCKGGLIHPRGMEWIYIRSLLRQDGVSDDMLGGKSGSVDSNHHEVQHRAVYWYKGKDVSRVPSPKGYSSADLARDRDKYGKKPLGPSKAPSRGSGKPLGKPLSSKAATKPVPPRPAKPLRSKGPQVDVSNISLSKLNEDAASMADSLTEQVTKSLGAGKKPLKKKKG